MRRCILTLLTGIALTGCGSGSGLSEQVEQRADNRAEAMEAAAENMTNALQRNVTREQAQTVRQAGEERAEAIRGAEIDATALTNEQKARLVTGDQGTSAPAAR